MFNVFCILNDLVWRRLLRFLCFSCLSSSHRRSHNFVGLFVFLKLLLFLSWEYCFHRRALEHFRDWVMCLQERRMVQRIKWVLYLDRTVAIKKKPGIDLRLAPNIWQECIAADWMRSCAYANVFWCLAWYVSPASFFQSIILIVIALKHEVLLRLFVISSQAWLECRVNQSLVMLEISFSMAHQSVGILCNDFKLFFELVA